MSLPARVDDIALDSLLTELLTCHEQLEAVRDEPDPAVRVLRAESVAAAGRSLVAHIDRVRRDAIVELGGSGMTVRAIAAAVGLSSARVGKILQEEAQRLSAEMGEYRMSPGDRQRHDLEAYRVARHAQEQRAEAYGLGYAEETAAFYGSESVAAFEGAETALTYRQWLENQRQPV